MVVDEKVETKYQKLSGPKISGEKIDLSKFNKPKKKKEEKKPEADKDPIRKKENVLVKAQEREVDNQTLEVIKKEVLKEKDQEVNDLVLLKKSLVRLRCKNK